MQIIKTNHYNDWFKKLDHGSKAIQDRKLGKIFGNLTPEQAALPNGMGSHTMTVQKKYTGVETLYTAELLTDTKDRTVFGKYEDQIILLGGVKPGANFGEVMPSFAAAFAGYRQMQEKAKQAADKKGRGQWVGGHGSRRELASIGEGL